MAFEISFIVLLGQKYLGLILFGQGIKMKNNRITIRIETKEREQLDTLITEGKIKNLTEPIYIALKNFLRDNGSEV